MSGHSKWSTIKHQKGVADQARGKLFSKLAKNILVVAKEGGVDPDTNYKLRQAIDEAKAANMPKDNIQRALDKVAGGDSDSIEEVTYEGFGPEGVGLLILATTDNRNRTGQEIKNLLEKSGGSLGGPSSVSFNFKALGRLEITPNGDADELMLELMDKNVSDVAREGENVAVYVAPTELQSLRTELEQEGKNILSSEFIQKPISPTPIGDPALIDKLRKLVNGLSEHDDVQKVFCSAIIDD